MILGKYYILLNFMNNYFDFVIVLVIKLGQDNEINENENGKYLIKTVKNGRYLLFCVDAD